ncbi:tRNA (guanosine(18)-2'-O)-methyltransferase TrmH [Alkalilimnicola sp. S0819]|uniref:tRNA (guanosine(18)-2'-O)-methyltransferase TrmH n=1 Tax=Alkalilimnicola sp. S0819 TaxID=2613922 RepID=UPI001261C17E|nr:tRNA (guanosine(18)-2'-O)-methyltransferase TrmH [Alkalilimnicola sp. S0819]KAB7623219.1 tRNA (guanosine(18)-2'-O)-methyltransferase TrmH [Alkalilimnicola sp. S0819]MPQ17068.1 tRNA (guanosine(18)-2'-O)-methyltransferase TrmH [Alkalilimnicola sp. S0819]
MTARRMARMRATLDRRQPDLRVLMDQVHKPHNISAILRTCDAVGVWQAHAVWPGVERFRARAHSSAGTGQWVKTVAHPDIAEGIGSLQREGFRIYAAHLSERAVDFRRVDYTRPCAVLLGAELHGVSDTAAELVDEHVIIPMAGLGASLNVSVAAAVILFEAQRQREAAGLYQQCRLESDVYERTLFEWLHPKIAARCRERGEPYLPIDEDGDLRRRP